jgi:hypothetical protein
LNKFAFKQNLLSNKVRFRTKLAAPKPFRAVYFKAGFAAYLIQQQPSPCFISTASKFKSFFQTFFRPSDTSFCFPKGQCYDFVKKKLFAKTLAQIQIGTFGKK